LEINEEPIHAIELLNEIHKFREHTSTKNIISNLKLDPNKKYKIFNQSFVGLKSKSYKSSLTYLPKFLGKTMINYIESNNKCKKDDFTEYFSKKLNISIKNTNFILQSLLESGFITLTNNNELIHENTRN
jgi:hypothetical protein